MDDGLNEYPAKTDIDSFLHPCVCCATLLSSERRVWGRAPIVVIVNQARGLIYRKCIAILYDLIMKFHFRSFPLVDNHSPWPAKTPPCSPSYQPTCILLPNAGPLRLEYQRQHCSCLMEKMYLETEQSSQNLVYLIKKQIGPKPNVKGFWKSQVLETCM